MAAGCGVWSRTPEWITTELTSAIDCDFENRAVDASAAGAIRVSALSPPELTPKMLMTHKKPKPRAKVMLNDLD